MIRFIDLRHMGEDISGRFAFWNTITDRFIADDFGHQAWDTIDELVEGFNGGDQERLKRMIGLAPEWAREPANENRFGIYLMGIDISKARAMGMSTVHTEVLERLANGEILSEILDSMTEPVKENVEDLQDKD